MIVLLIFVVGVFLRIYDLGTESFSFDETVSIHFAQKDLNSITNPPVWEVQILPLYYILLHFWIGFFGINEFAVRLLSAIFGILSILVLYKLGKTLLNFEIGLYSALILAVSMFHIKYSQEARMYSLLTFTTLLSIFFFVKILKENQLKFWAGYVAGSALKAYSHFYGLFILFLQGLLFLFYWNKNKKIVKRYVLAQLAVFFLFLPWLLKLLEARSYILSGHSPMAWLPRPDLVFLVGTFFVFSNGSVIGLVLFGALSKDGITKKKLGSYLGKLRTFFKSLKTLNPSFYTESPFEVVLCVLWICLPIMLSLLLSWALQPIYQPKYLIMVSPAFYLLVAKGLTNRRRKVRNILILVLFLDSIFMTTYHYVTIENEQWRDAARYIEENAKPNELILINAPWMELPFNHYFKGANLAKGVHTVDRLKEAITDNQHPNVWLILCHDEFADPEGLVKSELDKTYVLKWKEEYVSLDVLYSITFLGYPIYNVIAPRITVYYYVNFSTE